MTRITAIFLVAMALVLANFLEAYAQSICAQAVNQKIQEIGLKPGDVLSKTIIVERAGTEGGVMGHTAWNRLKSCQSGYLIMNMQTNCTIVEVFTSGKCNVSGVSHC